MEGKKIFSMVIELAQAKSGASGRWVDIKRLDYYITEKELTDEYQATGKVPSIGSTIVGKKILGKVTTETTIYLIIKKTK